MIAKKLPVTIVTGFLGSGKTTLLNRILQERHGQKIAVILNEIGDVNLDSELVLESLGEELKVMNNGCVCCTVRGDLTRICLDLVKKNVNFDHLVIETTGLADPSPVAQTFFLEEKIEKLFYLDAVVTVVDAKHIEDNLAIMSQTQEQIGFADVILLNKIDLVSTEDADQIEEQIRATNPLARIFRTARCATVDLGLVLGIRAFDLDQRVELDPHLTTAYHSHTHEEAIQSLCLEETKPLHLEKLSRFLQLVTGDLGRQLLRYKGVVWAKGNPNRIVFQGVHMMLESKEDRAWKEGEERKTRMVFIGRHLPRDALAEGLSLCAED